MAEREIVLDTETTGLDVLAGHRIIEIGCVELVDLRPTGASWQSYFNPRRQVDSDALGVHGLDAGFLGRQPLFEAKAQELLEFLGSDKLVMHNAEFDLKFLNHELRALNLEPVSGTRVTDTLTLARRRYPGQDNSLDGLAKRLRIDASARADRHGALIDAKLLAEVYIELEIERRGGRQAGLALAAAPQGGEVAHPPAAAGPRAPRPHAASGDELRRHQAFLDRHVENAIWHRYRG